MRSGNSKCGAGETKPDARQPSTSPSIMAPLPTPFPNALRETIQSLYRSCIRGETAAAEMASPGGDNDDGHTPADQLQSPLFKLPAEVRVVIWEYALGGELIHIEHRPDRTCYELPAAPAPVTWAQLHREERLDCGKTWAQKPTITHLNWHFTSTVCSKNATLPDGQKVSKGAILALPLSCKRIYEESIPFIYSKNTFDFKSPCEFLCFCTALPALRLRTIRSISTRLQLTERLPWYYDLTRSVRFRLPNISDPVWRQFCSAVQEMKGLQQLRANMGRIVQPEHIADVLRLLDELQLEKVIIEAYIGGGDIEDRIEGTGRRYEVEKLVPWDECFVTWAS